MKELINVFLLLVIFYSFSGLIGLGIGSTIILTLRIIYLND